MAVSSKADVAPGMPACTSAMNGGNPATLREWSTASVRIAATVLAVLLIGAVLRGAAAEALPVLLSAAAAALVWFSSFALRVRCPRTASFIRFFLPFAYYGAAYVQMHTMLSAMHAGTVDATLAGIDRLLFGVNPVAWLGAHACPVLTDALYLSYFSYYAGMPVLLVLMWRRNDEKDFRIVLSAMTLGWYGALLSYVLFPALGPQRFMPAELPLLHGMLPTSVWIRTFLSANLSPVVRDCVPSMHTGVTLLTLAFARRFQPAFFRAYVLPGLGLVFATMYLQQHYVIDVLLGICAFAAIYVLSTRLRPA